MIGFFSVVLGGLTIVVVVILCKNQSAEIKSFFLPGLILKLLSGITLGLVYTYYYPVGDTFGFFSDAQVLVDLARSNPGEYLSFLWQGDGSEAWASSLINSQIRSLFLVKVLSLITMFSFGNYWVASLYFSLISFVASWYVIRKLILHFPKGKWAAVVAFLFVPSFVFWSSGIVKESLAMAALMFLSGFYIASLRKDKLAIWEWITALIALIFLWNLKYYWAAIFVPVALTTLFFVRWLLPRIPKLRIGFEYILWLAVFCSVMLLASNIHPNFYLSRFL
ncbi:MAG: hypothetical protein RIA63_03245 [Cyclobacteriaceae bacterium]